MRRQVMLKTATLPTQQSTAWNSLPIGGGGYVTGIVTHPLDPTLIYIRTDVGGAYRWDPTASVWVPILDHFYHTDGYYYNVDGIAIDPNDANTVYICPGGGGWNGGLLKSSDRGGSWIQIANFNYNGNGDKRWHGEPIMVDPNNGSVIYSGTREEGLQRSLDGGSNWAQIASVPVGPAGIGLRSVAIDPATLASGRSATVYVAVRGSGVWRSTNGGNTFALMSGSPANPCQIKLASNGVLYVTHDAGMTKWTGSAWTSITPATGGWEGLGVSPTDPNKVIVCGKQDPNYFDLPVRYSTTAGTSWTTINTKDAFTNQVPWLEGYKEPYPALAAFAFDRSDVNQRTIWLTDWYSTRRTTNIEAATVTWAQQARGIEEMVCTDLISPPATGGALCLVSVADNIGFRLISKTDYPATNLTTSFTCAAMDWCEADPNQVFAVGEANGPAGAAYSNDNGVTWTEVTSPSANGMGKVACSATNNQLIVCVPIGSVPRRSTNRGSSWTNCVGAPSGAVETYWSGRIPIASDRVNGSKFYYLMPNGAFYRSTDGGANFAQVSTLAQAADWYWYTIKPMPGIDGYLFVNCGDGGLWRSTNSGTSWTQVSGVTEALTIGYGAPEPGGSNMTIYLHGRVGGVKGVWRSTDLAATWTRINSDNKQMGECVALSGDRRTFGRVYFATMGRGVFIGELA